MKKPEGYLFQQIPLSNNITVFHCRLLHLQWKREFEEANKLIRKAIEIDEKCDFAYETLATLEVQRYMKIVYFTFSFNQKDFLHQIGVLILRYFFSDDRKLLMQTYIKLFSCAACLQDKKVRQTSLVKAHSICQTKSVLHFRGNSDEAVRLFEKAIDLVRTEAEMAQTFSLLEAAKAQAKVTKRLGISLPSGGAF